MKPALSKVRALQHMYPPKNPSEVRSLLDMAQYSAQFIPNFAEITTPLHQLTPKWKWIRDEQKLFEALQKALSCDSVLGYEIARKTKLQVDAGLNGIGLILRQEKVQSVWQPVECASRRLTETEKRYSQIENEALAIRWACERCYMYFIGITFIVEADHKPLIPLFNNPNSHPRLRIERWLLYLQQFDFVLRYCPGKSNAADCFSRQAVAATVAEEKEANTRNRVVNLIIQDTVPKSITLTEIQKQRKEIKS